MKKPLVRFSHLAALFSSGALLLAQTAAADLSAGLVGYYTLNGSSKVNDNSGHFNNGRAVNTTWTSDRLGNPSFAASFPGAAGDYARVDSNPDLNFGTGDFSFALWMQFPSQNTGASHPYSAVLIRSGNANAPWEGPSVFADVVPGHVSFRVSSANQLSSAASSLNDNAWRHYAFVRESNVLKIYINGVLDTQAAVPSQDVSSSAHLYLGANHTDQTAQNFKGSMDELRIYNRALSVSEISTLSKAPPVSCTAPATSASLQAGRFSVAATWSNGGSTTSAYVNCGATTDQTAYFYWTDAGNSELLIKLLDFCSVSSTWSVYANGATDMNVNVTITDNITHATWTGQNPLGQGFQLIRAGAFPCN